MKHAITRSKTNISAPQHPVSHFYRRPLSAAICALMASPGLFSPLANAQQSGVLEEVVVTARKRTESVMDVPVSISAVSGDAINNAGITNITELFATVPGVENNANGSRIANKPSIRGVGSTENASIRQKVSSFIDGVPMIGAQGIGSFAGLERVEILRGPQSAAFGRSTFGGAINYVTRDPGDEFELNMRASFAEDDATNLSAVVSSPLGDKFGVIATLEEKNYDGDEDWETTSGDQLGGLNDKLGSIKLSFDPTDSISGEVMYIRQEIEDDGPTVLFANLDQQVPHPDNPSGVCRINGGAADPSCVILGEVDDVEQTYDYDYDNVANPIYDDGTDITRDRFHGSLSIDLDNGWNVTALAGYSEEEGFTWFDRDTFTGAMAIHATSTPDIEETYGEIRLASSADNDLNWLIGASIYDYDYLNTVYTNYTADVVMDIFSESANNIGAFFNLSYNFTDNLTGSFEGRYQEDEIEGTFPAHPEDGVPNDISQKDETTSFQPRLALTYSINDNHNTYMQVSRGNNPAGYNANALSPILQRTAESEGYPLSAYETFDEEEIWSYEIGFKGEISEQGIRYSAAIYYLDWEGYVQPVTANWTPGDGDLLPGTTSSDYFSRLFVNTGDLDGWGAEFEGQWAPTAQLMLGGMFSYSGLEFTDDSCSPIPIDYGVPAIQTDPFPCASVAGAELPLVSKYAAALNATYTIEFDNGWEGYGRLDYQYRSKRYTEQTNTDWLPSFDLVNLRFGVRAESWSVELFGNNVFDEDSPAGAVRFFDLRQPGMAFNTSVRQRRPRSIGIALTYDI